MSITLHSATLNIENRAPVSLEELQSTASYLIRKDRKYIVPISTLGSILNAIDAEARVLEIDGQRSFRYESLYFDTADLQSYFGALRRRPDRFKVRVRIYTDSGLTYLEAKTRDHHGRTVKNRMGRGGCTEPTLNESELRWLEHLQEVGESATALTHTITTSYIRTTLVLPRGEGRVTIDDSLRFSTPDGTSISIPSLVILESKGNGHATNVDRLLWREGIRPISISKYGCGLSLLETNLPSNRWYRVRNHMANLALR